MFEPTATFSTILMPLVQALFGSQNVRRMLLAVPCGPQDQSPFSKYVPWTLRRTDWKMVARIRHECFWSWCCSSVYRAASVCARRLRFESYPYARNNVAETLRAVGVPTATLWCLLPCRQPHVVSTCSCVTC